MMTYSMVAMILLMFAVVILIGGFILSLIAGTVWGLASNHRWAQYASAGLAFALLILSLFFIFAGGGPSAWALLFVAGIFMWRAIRRFAAQ
jgi:hypothetical protein